MFSKIVFGLRAFFEILFINNCPDIFLHFGSLQMVFNGWYVYLKILYVTRWFINQLSLNDKFFSLEEYFIGGWRKGFVS